jgi:hypothetical protein
MSFIEIISALVIVGLLCGIVVSSVGVLSKYTKMIVAYSSLKVYAVNKIEEIRTDLDDYEAGLDGTQPIDSIDYNDDGRGNSGTTERTGIEAKFTITSIGHTDGAGFYDSLLVYGKELYLVEYSIKDISTKEYIRGQTLLRGGCTANAD